MGIIMGNAQKTIAQVYNQSSFQDTVNDCSLGYCVKHANWCL